MHRNRALGDRQHEEARGRWNRLWAATWPIGLTEGIEGLAGDLARTRALSGSDAVHLASAVAVATDDFALAAWDARLRAGAQAEGLLVVPVDP